MEEKILALVNSILEEKGRKDLFPTAVQVKGMTGGKGLVRVFVDGDEGVKIDDCAAISRRLAEQVEELGLFAGPYNLEVSTPGVDQPLILPRQYPKHVGRTLQVHLLDGEECKGKLLAINDSELKLKSKKDEVSIPFENIEKAIVKVSFN